MKKDLQKICAFTFVELLLGFLIFSIVGLVLYSTLFSGLKIQQRSSDDSATYHEIKVALDMMGRELEQAIRFNFSKMAPELKYFEATATSLSFLIIDRPSVIKRIRYYLEDKDKVHIYQTLVGQHYQKNVSLINSTQEQTQPMVLMRSEEPFLDFVSKVKSSDGYQEVLLEPVGRDSLKWSYAYIQSSENKAFLSWEDVWDKDYIPAGMRLEVTLLPLGNKKQPMVVKKDIYIPTGFWGEPL
jgi:type II secretory pathway pseudopilin PulG